MPPTSHFFHKIQFVCNCLGKIGYPRKIRKRPGSGRNAYQGLPKAVCGTGVGLRNLLTLLADRHQIRLPSDFSRRFVVAIDVAVSCRPAGVKPTETIAFAMQCSTIRLGQLSARRGPYKPRITKLPDTDHRRHAAEHSRWFHLSCMICGLEFRMTSHHSCILSQALRR